MRATVTEDSALVTAAQSGDQRALHDLVSTHLPLVYAIARRAMGDHPDVDDVVQDTMLRALRELTELRNPASFRAWLSAIAVRQVSTHLQRQNIGAARTTTLDVVAQAPDAQAEFENVTMLELEVSDQRRSLERAARWLDPDDRALLSLWWLEVAGDLTRTEVATAIGVNVAHATVRIQRMRNQLHLSRVLVAALEARPGCPDLDRARAGWDGRPSPLWRKRLTRHTRSCPVCLGAAAGLVPPERLLAGFLLLPVPVTLAAGLLGKILLAASHPAPSTALTVAKTGLVSHALQAAAGHPVAVAVVATGAVISGAAVATMTWPAPQPPPPDVIVVPTPAPSAISATRTSSPPAPPTPAPTRTTPAATLSTAPAVPAAVVRPLVVGPVSLESATDPGLFVSTRDDLGFLTPTASSSSRTARQEATFEAVPGLADPAACFSFRLPDGRYLRHSSWRIRVTADDGQLFRNDATFCVRTGTDRRSVSLESYNYPGYFLHRRAGELWVDRSTGGPQFLRDSSFRVSRPLAR